MWNLLRVAPFDELPALTTEISVAIQQTMVCTMHSDENKRSFLSSLLDFLQGEGISADKEDGLYGAFDLLGDWLASNAANKTRHREVLVAASLINDFAAQRTDANNHILANEMFAALVSKGGGPVRELATYLDRDALEQLVVAYSRYVHGLGGLR